MTPKGYHRMPDGSLMKGARHAKLPERASKKKKSSVLTAFREGGKRLGRY